MSTEAWVLRHGWEEGSSWYVLCISIFCILYIFLNIILYFSLIWCETFFLSLLQEGLKNICFAPYKHKTPLNPKILKIMSILKRSRKKSITHFYKFLCPRFIFCYAKFCKRLQIHWEKFSHVTFLNHNYLLDSARLEYTVKNGMEPHS